MNTTATQPASDAFFSDLANDKPYFKAAFEGFAGSGKTFTMAQVAIGLHQRIGSTKPVIYFDTEKAAMHLRDLFAKAGIKVLRKDSRSLADLKESMRRCRDGLADILIIDSISHIWENFLESYKQRVKRQRLEFSDWGIIKPAWKAEFSDPFVRDPYHTFMTGRAGYEYENEINQETGKREIYKSGIKMKVEGETAYEPDMLVLMERFEEILGDKKAVWREATVLKDRSTLIDGRTFKNPSFADFAPVIDFNLSNPVARSETRESDAAQLFRTEEEKREFTRNRDILVEKIEAQLIQAWPGQGAEAKKARVSASEKCFGTTSWTEVTGMSLDKLAKGLEALKALYRQEIESQGEGQP